MQYANFFELLQCVEEREINVQGEIIQTFQDALEPDDVTGLVKSHSLIFIHSVAIISRLDKLEELITPMRILVGSRQIVHTVRLYLT